jgi:hypothetical protein
MRWPNGPARALVVALALAARVEGQQRVVVQGVASLEGWRTRGGSVLLARNDDSPGLAGTIATWAAADLGRKLTLVALTEISGGAASAEDETELELEELTLRWRPSAAFGIEAGRFPAPIGTFAARRLPFANPVIGAPDGYEIDYPWGVGLSGSHGGFDYRVAAMDRPVANRRYVPSGPGRMRLALGAGITPVVGVRIGLSYTAGPYLADSLGPALRAGERAGDFGERILVVEGTFTRGYFELRGESAFSRYEVPGGAGPVSGNATFAELRYTWTPRLFTATRLERNAYAFVAPLGGGDWLSTRTTFYDAELAVGYRLDAATLAKVSYRLDDWRVGPPLDQFLRNGTAFALQVSRTFDVTAGIRRLRGR